MTNGDSLISARRLARSAKSRRFPETARLAVSSFVVLALSACGGGLPYPGLQSEEVYNLGLQAVAEEDWGEAVKAFEYALRIPGFTNAPEARLLIAQAQFARERYILARSEFQRVLDRYPADTVARHASLGVCESYAALAPIPQRDQGPTQSAWATCGQVSRDYAGTIVGLRAAEIQTQMYDQLAQADYEVGEHYFKRGFWDSAMIYYEDVIALYPDSQWAPWSMYKIVLAFEAIGYQQDAKEYRERLLRSYPDSEAAKLIGSGGVG
jgi:outer membrane protein assembly factor BamD